MKRKRLLVGGVLVLAVLVLVTAMFAPQLRSYVAQMRMGRLPFAPLPYVPDKPSTGPTDGYGIYESCSPKEAATCLDHLNAMASAGFKLVINYSEIYGDADFQRAYLDRAQSVGMKVIISLKNPALYDGTDVRSEFPALAKTCGCIDNNGFIAYTVNLVKDHPALWGYYVGDEVEPNNHDRLKSRLADVVRQADPVHPRLFIDSAGRAVAAWRGNSPFFDTAEVIGSDFYPIRDNSPSYPALDQSAAVASGVQAYANTYKKGSAIVLQAFSYSNYNMPGIPYPTVDQMKYMLSQTLAYSKPRIVLWYSYYDTMSSDHAKQRWDALKSLIATPTGKERPASSH